MWKDADPGITEVCFSKTLNEDARKRVAGLESQQFSAFFVTPVAQGNKSIIIYN